MSTNEELLKSYKREKINLSSRIAEEKKDLYKYQNRKDYASVVACKERLGNLNSHLADIEKEITRSERIIKNDGVDPYSPITSGKNRPSTTVLIDDGVIDQTVDVTIDINGTKGKGKNKKTVNINQTQRIERSSTIKKGTVVDQTTNVINNSAPKNIVNPSLISNNQNKTFKYSDNINQSDKKPRKYARKARPSDNIGVNKSFKKKPWIVNGKNSNIKSSKNSESKSVSSKGAVNNYNKQNLNSKPKSNKWVKRNNVWVRLSDIQDFEYRIVDSKELKPEYVERLRIEKNRMDKFISLIKNGNSRSESCKNLNISPDIIKDWYNKGSHDFDKNTIYFYNEINRIEQNKSEKEKMDIVLESLRNGETNTVACKNANVAFGMIDKWRNFGMYGKSENTVYFYNEIKEIEKDKFHQNQLILDEIKQKAIEDGDLMKSDDGDVLVDGGDFPESDGGDVLVDDVVDVKIRSSRRKFCRYCGKRIHYKDNFCQFCGKKLEEDSYGSEGILDKIQRGIKRFF